MMFAKIITWIIMWLFPPRSLPKDVKTMLVIRRNRLGDAVITGLVLKNIQRTNPDLKITIIANKYTRPIFAYLLPNSMIYDEPRGNPISIYFSETMRKLRKETFDIAINGSGSYSSKTVYLLNCLQAKYTISCGHFTQFKIADLFVDDCSPLIVFTHQMHKIMSVFQRTGLKFIEPAMGIPTTVNKRKILLCPESNRLNVMPIEKWLDLYEQLNVANYIVNFCVMNIDLPNAIRPKNTEELLVLIQNYDHIISHDGGVSHIAAMFNKHCTTLCSIPGLKNSWTYNCQFIECNDLTKLNIKDIIATI